jgi:hypothetical protein
VIAIWKITLIKITAVLRNAVSVPLKAMHLERNTKTIEMIRRFIADIKDESAVIWLIANENHVAKFLENQADLLDREERFKVYGFMEGVFPKHFKRILTSRLTKESDPRCLELLCAISNMHSKDRI